MGFTKPLIGKMMICEGRAHVLDNGCLVLMGFISHIRKQTGLLSAPPPEAT